MYTSDHIYEYKVYCARNYPVLLDDMEAADISFMPIGRAPENDRGPRHFGGELFRRRTNKENWGFRRLDTSWGIQVYTGIPSERNSARWHDFVFTYQAICEAPDAVFACIDALLNSVANPLLTLTKTAGLRLSFRIPNYLHPDSQHEQEYIYKHTPTVENPHQRAVYLKILGDNGYSRWDARYEILLGNLLEPPIIVKEAVFAQIDALRARVHQPDPEVVKRTLTVPTAPLRLGSYQLDLAKESFTKRGFSYVRRDGDFHYWISSVKKAAEGVKVLLWQRKGTVWVRASMPGIGIPTVPTPITDVWDDTGIVPPVPANGLPVTDKIIAVRQGLSPLSIKRSPPILQKAAGSKKVDETQEKNENQMRRVFESPARIVGLILPKTGTRNTYETELSILHNTAICLNMPSSELAREAEDYFRAQNAPSIARWKTRKHRWNRVKDIPIDVRMQTPFQHGNVCEDPERCDALVEKGGNPSESICPQCPVYTECQDRGYLSQFTVFQQAKAGISGIRNLFFDPQYADVVDAMLRPVEETQRLCIINKKRVPNLFPKCMLSEKILQAWGENWQGAALGNFAKTLLNALETKGKLHTDAVKGVRAAIQAFEWQEEEIISQMCQVNVRGNVVTRGIVDADTGKELARLSIEFEAGVSAYIPLDDNAADKLIVKGLPVFRLNTFRLDEDMKIPMPMAEAIRLGILETKTLEDIREFPTVCSDPQWTFWHQLKRFFAHYTRDADTPISWNGKELHFRVPPVLHPSVKQLLVVSSTFSEQHLRRTFGDETIEVFRIQPTARDSSNQIFQIRTDIYPRETILDYDSTWDVIGVSETGQRFLLGIRAEIERDSNVRHAIIADSEVVEPLQDITATENVCFLKSFQRMSNVEKLLSAKDIQAFQNAFQTADVIWIVGAPERPTSLVWRRAQILFGNDDKPFSYASETGSNTYTDELIKSVYEQEAVSLLTEIFECIPLNHTTGKKIVLLTGLRLPNITDRPDTLLFDWEDFLVAGGLDKLAETIAIRQHFEIQRANLTGESSRQEVERILGCLPRHANRVLRKLRGGALRPRSLAAQILAALAEGEKKTAELIAAVDGYPTAIKNGLRQLLDAGEIVKVRRGVYALPKT